MATSNNPRKFSEKIALHTQKQAEETAAFQEVMNELSITRAARTDRRRTRRHHGLVDRVYRDRNRIRGRACVFVLHFVPHIDSCPYSAMCLSPPPETSWRRTNSDSALHQSTLNPTSQDGLTGGFQELQPKRVLLLTVPGGGGVGSEADEDGQQQNVTSRPCKVPGINIFPSLDQETNTLIPANHNTGGSLPDLTNIQFPPPLPTPLDPEDTATCPTLSATPTHLGLTSINPGNHRTHLGLAMPAKVHPSLTWVIIITHCFNHTQASTLNHTQASTLNYTQVAMMGLTGGHGNLPNIQQLGYSIHGNIPNIILTVTGETPPSLSKELNGALSMDVSFDAHSPFPLDELKMDPLTQDGLLTGPGPALADGPRTGC
ncbi:CREB-regulated transcription coactivator 1-like [Conger conger]|uniref:CREB-regulated transcription coactivator 1-like n=1 Tax=Conger conger TaxID=82655 RepID=UPI002A59FD10|nr:CREB-regulated transcription coactivator 1-like [Conger conger]